MTRDFAKRARITSSRTDHPLQSCLLWVSAREFARRKTASHESNRGR